MEQAVYTFEDYDYIYRHYNVDGAESVAAALNRSVQSVNAKAVKMNLVGAKEFTQQEKEYVRNYGKVLGTALVFLMPGRTSFEVKEMLACKNRK